MASMKFLIPAMAIVGRAAAATCSVDPSSTMTIQNAGDATALASCQTFTGSIAIATGTVDNIAFNGIQEITGNLTAENVGSLASLSSADLETIGDRFSLSNLTVLTSLNFPRLNDISTIDWIALPALEQLSFTTTVQMAQSVSIQNTKLGSLNGINLQMVNDFVLANNYYLSEISMQIGNVSDALRLEANGKNVTANFPNLIWANNMTLNNVSSLSIPSLESVNGSFGLNSDYFTSISGPNLTSVGQSLSFVSCPQLTNISFPLLQSIGGGLQVANNTALKDIDGFPALQSIGGALDYYGNFSNASLPSIKDIRGAFNMQSTQDLSKVCPQFDGLSGSNNVIQGTYNCTGKESNPQSVTGNGGSSGTSGSSAQSSGAASTLQLSGATGLMGVVAAIFGLL